MRRNFVHHVSWLLACAMLAAASNFGCRSEAAVGDRPAEGMENGDGGVQAARKARRSGLANLQALWSQRASSDVVPRVLPFLGSASATVRTRAAVMLGRLEDSRALKALQTLRPKSPSGDWTDEYGRQTPLYPELSLAVGRIKARKLNGKPKLNAMLSEVGLNLESLAALTRQLNTDNYGAMKLGNVVVEEVLDVLAKEKRRGRAVDELASGLTLRPAQKALLQAVAASPTAEAKRLLDYLAQGDAIAADQHFLIEHLLDLNVPNVVLNTVDAALRDHERYPSPVLAVQALQELAKRKSSRASAMLKAIARDDRRPDVRARAQSALNQLAY